MSGRRVDWLLGALGLVGLLGCEPDGAEPPSGLTIGAERGEAVVPGRALRFPEDHGPHPRQGIEWWYLTATLEDPDGAFHGIQWTLFRLRGAEPIPASKPGQSWWQGQWYLAHLAWSPPPEQGPHRAWERWGRGGLGGPGESSAGVRAAPFVAWLDHWRLQSSGEAFLPLRLVAEEAGFALALTLDESPLVLHGDGGYSEKSADGALASYYYSLPRLRVRGHLKGDKGWMAVRGKAWLDREWSSRFLDARFAGWDWLSLQLDSAVSVMLFCLRPGPGQDPGLRHCAGSWISPAGAVTPLAREQIHWRPEAWVRLDGVRYPVRWALTITQGGTEHRYVVATRSRDQRNQLSMPYWEGPVMVTGADGETPQGVGFVELTGYRAD